MEPKALVGGAETACTCGKQPELTQEYFSLKEVAKYFGIGTRMIRTLRETGRIPFIKVGRELRFDIVAVEKALKEETKRKEATKFRGNGKAA